MHSEHSYKPIGVFDSGYGGLTILKEIVNTLPQYDYLYLGDNARTPYGSRSFESVYKFTLECVKKLFESGCHLVILACNTASAKALRTIQQKDLPLLAPEKRVLGVIRPTAEIIGKLSKSGHVGILATRGTVNSCSYLLELEKLYPELTVSQEACPTWVPLVENNEFDNAGGNYFIKKHTEQLMAADPAIDAIILGCTHYPILESKIRNYLPAHVQLISQGQIVANSLTDYLNRQAEIEQNCSKGSTVKFFTTDNTATFDEAATLFYGEEVKSEHIRL